MTTRWLVLRAAARLLARTAAVLVLVGLLIAAAPVTLVAAASAWVAWLRGSAPGRLRRAVGWQLPMIAAWLAAIAVASRAWPPVAAAPYRAWITMWHLIAAGSYPRAAVVIAPVAIPLGVLAGAAAWSYRLRSMAAGAGGISPGSAASFDRRQWRHQVRSASARIAAPGAIPLTTRAGDVVVGAVIRTVGHPAAADLARLPFERLRSHQVVIGGTGTGKTTLLLRLWAAYLATAMRRYAAGQGRPPLLVVLDCKGGADARRIADRARRVLRAAGARTTAIWPDEASLSIWTLPPHQLITTLVDVVEHGTGGAAYYADILDAVVALAVNAPGGPPAGSRDFLARLDPGWLTLAYQSAGDGTELELIRSAGRQIPDVALRYRTLFRRLGTGLDGPGTLDDADAWYCILEGTAEVAVAEAQARALIDLLASYLTSAQASREVLLAVDEFSAVSRRLPIWSLYERARSLGLAVQVSAQSWHGLAPDDSDRYRIVSAAEGGIWLLRTPHPEPVTGLVGQRKALDTSRHLLGFPRWSRAGSARVRDLPVADPALVRTLDVGQAAYLYRGGVTFVQVSRLVGTPPALAPSPLAAAMAGAPRHGSAAVPGTHLADPPGRRPSLYSGSRTSPAVLADIAGLLDAAFGPEPGRTRSANGATPPAAGTSRTVAGEASLASAGQPGIPDQETAPSDRTEPRQQAAPSGGPAGSQRAAPAQQPPHGQPGTPSRLSVARDPFGALGLAASADLTDDDVRGAWRRVAAATHPDRADGGDPAAFTAAAAAYSDLRTQFGRGEALADRRAADRGSRWRRNQWHRGQQRRGQQRHGHPHRGSFGRLAPPWVTRAAHGRPVRLGLRVLAAAALSGLVVAVNRWQPASPALIVGLVIGVIRGGRHDLAARPPSAGQQPPPAVLARLRAGRDGPGRVSDPA